MGRRGEQHTGLNKFKAVDFQGGGTGRLKKSHPKADAYGLSKTAAGAKRQRCSPCSICTSQHLGRGGLMAFADRYVVRVARWRHLRQDSLGHMWKLSIQKGISIHSNTVSIIFLMWKVPALVCFLSEVLCFICGKKTVILLHYRPLSQFCYPWAVTDICISKAGVEHLSSFNNFFLYWHTSVLSVIYQWANPWLCNSCQFSWWFSVSIYKPVICITLFLTCQVLIVLIFNVFIIFKVSLVHHCESPRGVEVAIMLIWIP